ncbi:hypothetical protein CEP52_017855 [Fusarium oligoseptatum]|uniref:Uncharacterized protein n=1 Tax=Fusarium oligoseptatum TaxID=2604345 RepID=A0A428RCZ0_9HYPO|nr:hypothetical protein CEP52_017855 [Fusarium oligoseptatum]
MECRQQERSARERRGMSHGGAAGLRPYPTPGAGLRPISQAIFLPHVRSALRPTPASFRILVEVPSAAPFYWSLGA